MRILNPLVDCPNGANLYLSLKRKSSRVDAFSLPEHKHSYSLATGVGGLCAGVVYSYVTVELGHLKSLTSLSGDCWSDSPLVLSQLYDC